MKICIEGTEEQIYSTMTRMVALRMRDEIVDRMKKRESEPQELHLDNAKHSKKVKNGKKRYTLDEDRAIRAAYKTIPAGKKRLPHNVMKILEANIKRTPASICKRASALLA